MIESPVKNYLTEFKDLGAQRQKIIDDIAVGMPYFNQKMKIAEKNKNYWMGNQWTAADRKKHTDQRRQAMTINVVSRIVKDYIGMQINTSLDPTLKARSQGDEDAVHKLNKINKWTENINDFDNLETQIFIDAFVKGAGWTGSRWDTTNFPHGCTVVDKIRNEEIGYDLNSRKLDLSDARYIYRIQLREKLDLLESYPKHKETIELENSGSYETWGTNLVWQRWLKNHGFNTSIKYRDLCPFIEYYEKVLVYNYTIIDEISNDEQEYDEYDKAYANYEGRCKQYALDGEMLIGDNGTPRIVLLTNNKEVIRQTIMIGNSIISDGETSLPIFPYVPCFANFLDGEYWSEIEGMIDEQDIINRAYSNYDQQLGAASKSGFIINPIALSVQSEESIRNNLNSPTPVVFINPQHITPLPQPSVNPAFYNIIQFATGELEKSVGGNALLGRGASAESGAVAEFRAQQGSKGRLFLFDHLKTWKKQVTLLNSWYNKNFMSEGQTIRVTGGDEKSDYIVLDEVLLDSIKGLKYDIIITETNKSDSVRQAQFEEWRQLVALNVLPPEITAAMGVELMVGLTNESKERIYAQMQFYQDWQKQKQQEAVDQKNLIEAQNMYDKQQIKEGLKMQDRLKEIQSGIDSQSAKVEASSQKLQDDSAKMHMNNLTPEQMQELQKSMITQQMTGEENGIR